MKKIYIILLLFLSTSNLYSLILSRPDTLDFENVYQGKEYRMDFYIRTEEGSEISLKDIKIKDIIIRNRNISIIENEEKNDSMALTAILNTSDMIGRFSDKIEILYINSNEPDQKRKLEIEIKAFISLFYIISPPSIIIRDLVKEQTGTFSIFVETKDKIPFKIKESTYSSDNCKDIIIEDISEYRKKITLLMNYGESGRYFEKLEIITDIEDFSRIEIETLANIMGFIKTSKRDIPFGLISEEENYERTLILSTLEGMSLDITEITHDYDILIFEKEQEAENIVKVNIRLDTKKVKKDFFGNIIIKAKADDHSEELKITYHGRINR